MDLTLAVTTSNVEEGSCKYHRGVCLWAEHTTETLLTVLCILLAVIILIAVHITTLVEFQHAVT